MKTRASSRSAQRGSLLIAAMILSAVIAISIVSYLSLARTGMQISNRALYNNGSMNLAENGLEQSVFAINKALAGSFNWNGNGWEPVGSNVRQKWTSIPLGQGATGTVRAYIYDPVGGAAPKIFSRSTVTLAGSTTPAVEKWIEVDLRKTSKFSNGMVAKNTISFSGNNASVDSWNSHSDTASTADDVAYSATTKRANGSVGSISVSVAAVAVNNADIWGYASTGGALPSVGSNGLIGPYGTGSGQMDMTHVSTDFAASFDPVVAPTATYSSYGGAISTTVSLPRAGTDTIAADGYYYIEADSINFNNKVLTITNKVILKLTNTLTAIDIGGGSGELKINAGAELQIYAPGDIKIAGNGVTNGATTAAGCNTPSKMQFYGTKTSGVQDIQIAGNGVLSAIVYAPQGSVKINGNGDVCGSVVANDITCVGNAAFHYDESLANFGGNNPYRVSKWKELTTKADRDTNLAILNW